MKCRFDGLKLSCEFVDLGFSPPSNSYLSREQLLEPETYFPLKLYVSERTWLVQLAEFKRASEIFDEKYAYFSSYSRSWLQHAKTYVDMIVPRLGLGSQSFVLEIASNDGYLLQYFGPYGVATMGIEPSGSVSRAAREKGIDTLEEFFTRQVGLRLNAEGRLADLIIGNNVLAHVPDVNDFVQGLKLALSPTGTITLEFPHLMELVDQNQYDTIYHEHYSYFSLYTAGLILEKHGLVVYDVEQIPTHGGSLRVYLKHSDDASKSVSPMVDRLLDIEKDRGMRTLTYYQSFADRVRRHRLEVLKFLIQAKEKNLAVGAYGAAAKGSTLLNYCGVDKDLVEFVADLSVHKQGKYLPGSHIPIVSEERIRERRPDFILILPWNLRAEISEQLHYIREWGGQFVVPIPQVEVF